MSEPATPHAEDAIEGWVGPGRRRMPTERSGRTRKVKIYADTGGSFEFYLTANSQPDGTLGEIFVKGAGKEGSTTQGLLDGFATAFSIALQFGAEFPMMARKFHAMRFEPHGRTDEPNARTVTSMIDAIMLVLVEWYGDEALRAEILR